MDKPYKISGMGSRVTKEMLLRQLRAFELIGPLIQQSLPVEEIQGFLCTLVCFHEQWMADVTGRPREMFEDTSDQNIASVRNDPRANEMAEEIKKKWLIYVDGQGQPC